MPEQGGIHVSVTGTHVDLTITKPNGHQVGMWLTADAAFALVSNLMSAAVHAEKAANDEP